MVEIWNRCYKMLVKSVWHLSLLTDTSCCSVYAGKIGIREYLVMCAFISHGFTKLFRWQRASSEKMTFENLTFNTFFVIIDWMNCHGLKLSAVPSQLFVSKNFVICGGHFFKNRCTTLCVSWTCRESCRNNVFEF